MKKLQTIIATLCAAGALTLPVTPAHAAEKTSFDAVTAKLDPNLSLIHISEPTRPY